ncbi:hypothetical protein N8I84_40490 [Streptomyces cynarae]|uniref:Uncharacterized protein n=1 Tax=Streptomyces cynarae TaxID=2981134 RepID=A0ABY6ECF5_9ACTN|nr:hypothetical protein [Streptomyces cynarae]UXY24254.1 hypothetical protein N8I84_40490 [Streptomyces cynarae]
MTMLPVEVAVAAMTEMADGERLAHERRLLKNAEDEYAAAARALAACQAGEKIAEQLHDLPGVGTAHELVHPVPHSFLRGIQRELR